MIRKLLIVFVSGLVLSVLLLSAAWVIGGDELMTRARRDFAGWDFDGGHYHGPTAKRSLAFDSAKILKIAMPVTLRFTRGPSAQMTVSGPAGMIDALRWENGELSLDDGRRWHHGGLTVTIVAPQIAGLELRGPGHIKLRDLDQPSLLLDVHGPSDLEASGKVESLDIASYGVGSLDLADVEARDAKIRVHGVGDVDISASGTVDATLHGVGNVTLHRKPANLISQIHGVGGVREDYEEPDAQDGHADKR